MSSHTAPLSPQAWRRAARQRISHARLAAESVYARSLAARRAADGSVGSATEIRGSANTHRLERLLHGRRDKRSRDLFGTFFLYAVGARRAKPALAGLPERAREDSNL